MWPHSLLFSSDEKASRALTQAFRELEFEVEICPEIFSAVEKITGRSFDVVVSDWNEGLEAAFLLRSSRELEVNQAAFAIAIANPEAAKAAHEAGADLILSRPIVAQDVKYALLTCDPFLAHMKTWLPRLGFPPHEEATPKRLESRPLPGPVTSVAQPARPILPWPSPPAPPRVKTTPPVVPAESIFDEDLFYRSRVQTTFPAREPSFSSAAALRRKPPSRVLPSMAIAIAFLSVGYVFSEPLRGQGPATGSVVQICGRVLERTQAWLRPSDERKTMAPTRAPVVQTAENDSPPPTPSGRGVTHIRVTEVKDPFLTDGAVPAQSQSQRIEVQPLRIEAQQSERQAAPTPAATRIPDSLRAPVQNATMRSVAARITPSLLAALEPVALSEDFSRRLLLQKVLPNYPEQAVRARLQGPVVLQAWIGRDGTIQELKLIRGSLLLGQAAYQAVKQWRYQPYLVNGRAVEAQTLVTVDFKLP
jgi:TonB family protein